MADSLMTRIDGWTNGTFNPPDFLAFVEEIMREYREAAEILKDFTTNSEGYPDIAVNEWLERNGVKC